MSASNKLLRSLWHLKPLAFIAGGIGCLWMAASSAYDVGAVQGITASARLSEKCPERFDEIKEGLREIDEL